MSLLLDWYPGNAVVEFVGQWMLVVALLIGLAAGLSRLVLRRRPAARNALWLGVLAFVAVSPLLLATVERVGWVWSVRRPDVFHEDLQVRPLHTLSRSKGNGVKSESPSNTPLTVDVPAAETVVAAAEEERAANLSVTIGSSGWTSMELWQMAASAGILGWLAGIVLLSIRLWHGHRQICRLISELIPIQDNRLDVPLQKVTATFGVSHLPSIASSPTVSGPVVVGLVRPIVVLPDDVVNTTTPEQLTDVLMHECAHVLRYDTWISLIQRLVQMAFWPHPLIYFLNRSLSRACEEVCDNYVLQCRDAVGYAETLLGFAERYRPVPTATGSLAMFSPQWKLQDRVAGILDPRRQTNTRVGSGKLLSVIGLLMAAGSLLAAGRFDDDEAPKVQDQAAVASVENPDERRIVQSLQEITEVSFTDCPLDECISYLKDLHNIKIRLDEAAFQEMHLPVDTPVTAEINVVVDLDLNVMLCSDAVGL